MHSIFYNIFFIVGDQQNSRYICIFIYIYIYYYDIGLQLHYAVLQSLALDQKTVENVPDDTLPKYEILNKVNAYRFLSS